MVPIQIGRSVKIFFFGEAFKLHFNFHVLFGCMTHCTVAHAWPHQPASGMRKELKAQKAGLKEEEF